LKKLIDSVWFRFYKTETEPKPNRKKPEKKPSQTRKKPSQNQKNRAKPEKNRAKTKKTELKKPNQTGFFSKKPNRTKTGRFEPVLVWFFLNFFF
jgi:hypothetical protein